MTHDIAKIDNYSVYRGLDKKSLYFYRVIIFYILPHHVEVNGVDLYQWVLPVIVSQQLD